MGISHRNGVALSGVSHLNAIAIAAIAYINGVQRQSGTGMTRTAVDTHTFTAADNTHPSGLTDLCNGNGQIQIQGNAYRARYGSLDSDSRCPGTYTDDQYAKVTVSGFDGNTDGSRIGVGLRYSADVNPNRDGYRIYVQNDAGTDSFVIAKVVNDTHTVLATNTTQTWANGDTVEAEVTGSSPAVITALRNGAVVFSHNDSTSPHTTGKPAIYAYQGSEDVMRGDNLEAGTLS
jgi:hypothetical protein